MFLIFLHVSAIWRIFFILLKLKPDITLYSHNGWIFKLIKAVSCNLKGIRARYKNGSFGEFSTYFTVSICLFGEHRYWVRVLEDMHSVSMNGRLGCFRCWYRRRWDASFYGFFETSGILLLLSSSTSFLANMTGLTWSLPVGLANRIIFWIFLQNSTASSPINLI